MTTYLPTFSVQEFENRGYTNPYFSPDQELSAETVESRVNSQLDWLAQILGWNGPDYWGNLVSSVSQKRNLLGGTFGVYNGYIYPKVIAVRNWDSARKVKNQQDVTLSVIEAQDKAWILLERDSRIQEGQTLVVGNVEVTISEIRELGNQYEIYISEQGNELITEFQNGNQLQIKAPSLRPAPFYRPLVNTSADTSFLCAKQNDKLVLFPEYNTDLNLPYKLDSLIVGGQYTFDEPIYLSKSQSRVIEGAEVEYPQDVLPVYDPDNQVWVLTVPEDLARGEFGDEAYLVWLYSNPELESFCVKEVILQRWYDPSDWNTDDVINYYRGSWGNKGGFLPLNFVFDSLELSGFDERKSILLEPLEAKVGFDTLLNFVYYQRAAVSPTSPGISEQNEVWWNSATGSFSVWSTNPYGCADWEEIYYPEMPINRNTPEYVFPTVSDFEFSQESMQPNILVEIEDITGLSISNNVLGLLGTLTASGSLKLYKNDEGFWVPFEFVYQDELDFDADALNLPWNTKVILSNAQDLGIPRTNYEVTNLKIIISEPMPVELYKTQTNKTWEIKPTSELKYIGKTRLFSSSPNTVDGALNWYYSVEDEEVRRAVIFYYGSYEEISPGEWQLQGVWVDINSGEATPNPPTAPLDFGTVLVYCNGVLVTPNTDAGFEDFQFSYEVDPSSGEFIFKYTPITFQGVVNLPVITISDSVTTAFTFDISDYVFGGSQYYMSPNVLDSETPLRLWKVEDLQVKGDNEYVNPLIADQNNGPGDSSWGRYHIRLSPRYGRNDPFWQKVALVAQNFGYWGSPVQAVETECPSEERKPRIYEQVYLFNESPEVNALLYSEPYLYSDIFFGDTVVLDDFSNSGVLPQKDNQFDDFYQSSIGTYEPLHNRRAKTDLPVGKGYGDWEGAYLQPVPCTAISGYVTKDLKEENVFPIEAPLWDASMYKLPVSCEVAEESYKVDMNNFKVEYAYFAADLSCAEDGFFDIHQECSWRIPENNSKTLYMVAG